jgi:hypothetical protein
MCSGGRSPGTDACWRPAWSPQWSCPTNDPTPLRYSAPLTAHSLAHLLFSHSSLLYGGVAAGGDCGITVACILSIRFLNLNLNVL